MQRYWHLTKDGDVSCLAMYERHYSAHKYKDGCNRKIFCGAGEKIVLRTKTADAIFVWKKFIDGSGQKGINCAVFGNESGVRSWTLSDRLTKSLISAGLVKGIAPMSIQKQLGVPIPDFVLYLPDGTRVEQLDLG